MRALLHDLRFGFRLLLSSPAFSAVAVLTLALGIAVNTTVFNWIHSVLLRPIAGAAEPERLAILENVTSDGGYINMSYPDYRDYRDGLRLVSGLSASFGSWLRLGDGEAGQEVQGELVTGNYFDVMGVKPHLGRFFSREESADPPALRPVAVISHRLWQSRFNGDPRILGSELRVNGRSLTVIGVAPEGFYGNMACMMHDVWVPLTIIAHLNRAPERDLSNRWTRNLVVFARLKPGVTLAQANADATAKARALSAAYPRSNENLGVSVQAIADAHTGAQAVLKRPLQILLAVGGVVLLIVCANVANLLLARATARQKEFAIRMATGASRTRVARQLLAETLLLALTGGALGALLAPWAAGALTWLLPPVNIPVRFDDGWNPWVLGFTAALCLGSTVISGMAPLVCSLRPNLSAVLKEGGRGAKSGGQSHRARSFLVMAEVGLAVVALIGAGLFVKSFRAARGLNPGFDPTGVAIARFQLANTGQPKEVQQQFCLRLRQRLESSAGIEAVTYSDSVPLDFDSDPWADIHQVEGYTPAKGENMKLFRSLVAPGYFALLQIPLVAGRDFTDADDTQSPSVLIVNEAFAQRFFGARHPLGHKIRVWGRWHTVVGVVRNARYHHISGAPEPYFYAPYRQAFNTGLHSVFYLRTAGDPRSALATLRVEAAAIDPAASAMDPAPLAEHTQAAVYSLKVAAALLTVLGALAAILAAVGLYCVLAYAVAQRTHEVGLRMALGARSGQVTGMVIREGMSLVAAGLAGGVLLALGALRFIEGMLVGVRISDPATLLAASALLLIVALFACYVPARRATRVDPMIALRCQ